MKKQKNYISIILSFCMIMIFLSGQFLQSTIIADAATNKITLNYTVLTLQVGESKSLIAAVSPHSGEKSNIKWTSGNKKIATVSSTGKIKAVSAGTVTIKATVSGKAAAACKVTVKEKEVAVESIVLNVTEMKGHTGSRLILKAAVKPSSAKSSIIWSSSNYEVASVDRSGGVTLLKEGTAVIIAKAKNGVMTACIVTVQSNETEDTNTTTGSSEETTENSAENTGTGEGAEQSLSQGNGDTDYTQGGGAADTEESTGNYYTPGPDNYDISLYAGQVLGLVNEERSKAGLLPLTMSPILQEAAGKRALELASYYSHTRPDGQSWYTVLADYGINNGNAAENIAHSLRTPAEVMDAWMNSPGHRAAILNNKYNQIGIGVYESDGELYWSQLFTD